ncbi:MAG: hypothetical protein KF802_03315 [Bdellovibrionaceae bacterium]|nr:hypothetical protein [Pseudobdellovibrionaceae bacterium]
MGKTVLIFFLGLLCSLSAGAVDFSSQQECLEYHRSRLDQRNLTQQCKGKNQSSCQNQYGEDYVSTIENTCRQYFSSQDTAVTTPPQMATDCSSATQSQLQAAANSCLSLGEVAGTRCSTEEAQQVIQMAGRRAQTNINDSSSQQRACQEMQNFSAQAESAMRNFEARCEPAITEGQAVCARARQMIDSSGCAAKVKSGYNQSVSRGLGMFTTHQTTLGNARQNVQAAKQSGTETASCLANTAAQTASNLKDSQDKGAAATLADTAAAAATTVSATDSAGGRAPGAAAGSNSLSFESSPTVTANAEKTGASSGAGQALWDLPRSPAASAEVAALTAASDGETKSAPPPAGGDEKDKSAPAKGTAADILSGTDGGSGGGRGFTGFTLPASSAGPADKAGLKTKSPVSPEDKPDLSRFLPSQVSGAADRGGSCASVARDGITGPHCSQWEKIRNRYQFLRSGLYEGP